MANARHPGSRIYVAAHVAGNFPNDPGYVPIQAGRALADRALCAQGDDTGDSISAMNRHFSELTALYWIWKNDTSHIVGLSHYRRYFVPRRRPLPFNGIEIAAAADFPELAEGADIVVPLPLQLTIEGTKLPLSLAQHYADMHDAADLFLARQELKRQAPEYLDAFDHCMRLNRISAYNMFVARKAAIDEYCAWLFGLLFALEKLIPYEFYDAYQGRVFSFLAERLFNVWLLENRGKYRVVQRRVVGTVPNIW